MLMPINRFSEQTFVKAAQWVLHVVIAVASRQPACGLSIDTFGGAKTIDVVAKAYCIFVAKEDRGIHRAAIFYRAKRIGLTAGGVADLNNLDADTLQAVYDGFAGRASLIAGQYIDAAEVE